MNLITQPLFARNLPAAALLVIVLVTAVPVTLAQKVESKDRDRGLTMLSRIKDELKKNYYDPGFHGIDIDTSFKAASEKVKEAKSVGQIFGIIAQSLVQLDDSHTYFIPPSRVNRTDYGWSMQAIGDRVYVTEVDKGSDAESKGVKPGDEVLKALGYDLVRENLWKFDYLVNTLRPQPSLPVTLRNPTGEVRELDLLARQKQGKQIVDLTNYNEWMDIVRKSERRASIDRDRFLSFGDQLLIWKMNEFDLTDPQIDDAMSRARKHKALILDLRGNGGGWITTITRLVSNLFDHDIKIADSKSRKETKPVIAKSRGEKIFTGKLTILVDSGSASASEVLARTVQLEKRGNIVGDQTAGAVMAARHFGEQVGIDVVIFYGFSITMSDLIMPDGNSLEHHGVMPDEIRLPTAADLAAGRDTVLSYAASLHGVALDPLEAGKFTAPDPRMNNY
jgi:carboxyl-terminal processing protease